MTYISDHVGTTTSRSPRENARPKGPVPIGDRVIVAAKPARSPGVAHRFHPDVSRTVNLLLLDVLLVMAAIGFAVLAPMDHLTRLLLIGQLALWWSLLVLLGGYDVISQRGTPRAVAVKVLVLSCIAQLLIEATLQNPVSKEILLALAFLSFGSLLGRTLVDHIGRDRVLAISTSTESSDALDTMIITRGSLSEWDLTSIVRRAELINASVVEIQPDCNLTTENVQELCWELRLARVSLRFPVTTGPADARRVARVPDARGVLIELRPPHASWGARVSKRLLDVVVAAGLLVLTAPLLVILGAVVRATSTGPALYLQERVGRDGRPFRMIKFRSMVVDADARLEQLLQAQGKGAVPLFKIDNDPRLTRVGAVMRRYSLDELPQLLNVLMGSMSLVGPRPQRRSEVDLYDNLATQRLGVLPGMTGLWQVSGRSRLSWQQAIALDVNYVHNWSLRHDLKILARTAKAVLGTDGAV